MKPRAGLICIAIALFACSIAVAAAAQPEDQAQGQDEGGQKATAAAADKLTVAPNKCRVTVFENAVELATVEAGEMKFFPLKLDKPTNVVGMVVEVEQGVTDAWVQVTFDSLKALPDHSGPWLQGSPEVEGWLTSPKPPKGFRPVVVRNSRIAVPPGRRAYRQMVARPQTAPAWFPKMNVAYAVRGSRQLIKPYLPALGLPFAYDYRLTIGLPAGMMPAGCDGGVGAKPDRVRVNRTDKYNFARLYYNTPPASPFGIYICWADKSGTTIKYEPAIRIGGTYGWRRLSAVVRAPDNAASAHPIVLKWAGDKVIGEAWIDNVVLRAADDKQKKNLLPAGNFEGDVWKGVGAIEKAGRGGSQCLHTTLPEELVDKTRGWWIPPKAKTPVVGGKRYIIEADVRAEGVHVRGSRPHAAVLVACPDEVPQGEYKAILEGASRTAGARVLPTEATVRVLPHLLGRHPERVRLMPCYYGDPFTDPQVIRAFAENARQSGITWTYGRADCQLAKLLIPRGHKVVCAFGRQPFGVGAKTRAYLKEHSDLQALWFDGKRRENVACPTWMLSPDGQQAREELKAEIKARLATGRYAGFNWDIEQPVVDPPTFCVCPRCLAAFRKFAGLPEDFELKPEFLLKEPLRSKWVQFRCRQNAELVKLVAGWVKEIQPDIEFSVYSGYQSKWTMEHYGVDWRLLAPIIDVAMSGYGFRPDEERATMEAMGGKPYMAGELYYLSPTSDQRPPPVTETWAVSLLRQVAFTGGHGVVIWYLPVFDGATFYLTSLAADIIARYEIFFTRGEHCEADFSVDGLDKYSWFALRYKKQALLLLLNFTDRELQVKVASEKWKAPGTVSVPAYRPAVVICETAGAGAAGGKQ